MTISYSGNLAKNLLRWRGSLWQAVWKELLVFLFLYFLVKIIYVFVLNPYYPHEYAQAQQVTKMFQHYTQYIPITFLLGFYVANVVARWWQQFTFVPWPDSVIGSLCFLIPGTDEDSKLYRHRIGRYLCLTLALSWRDISLQVRQRFPTENHLVKAGLMTEKELIIFKNVPAGNIRWSLPLQWTLKIIRKLTSEGSIPPNLAAGFVKDINTFREQCLKLYCYDWVCIPLAYTQVTAVATYGYFAFCIVGRQHLENREIDLIFPIFTSLQFLFYVGWFKVAQVLMRPFGTDDDDIELTYLLNRHIQSVFATLEHTMEVDPPHEKDAFWGRPLVCVGHTKTSFKVKEHPPKLHARVDIKCLEDEEIIDFEGGVEENLFKKKRMRKKAHNLRPF